MYIQMYGTFMKGKQLCPFKSITQINPLVSSHYLFVGKMLSAFQDMPAAYTQVHFRGFYHGSKHYEP